MTMKPANCTEESTDLTTSSGNGRRNQCTSMNSMPEHQHSTSLRLAAQPIPLLYSSVADFASCSVVVVVESCSAIVVVVVVVVFVATVVVVVTRVLAMC